MTNLAYIAGFHDMATASLSGRVARFNGDTQFTYTFENFFQPFIGELIAKLNKKSLKGMLDPDFLEALDTSTEDDRKPPNSFFKLFKEYRQKTDQDDLVIVEGYPKKIDVSVSGPYANYNWELFFHIPLTIAVHLSKTQRFAEAQRWFHYIFDPTSNDQSDDPIKRFWKFLAFRDPDYHMTIDNIVQLLSMPDDKNKDAQQDVFRGYQEILNNPFQPHRVARIRHLAYQYCVVMKYLDNLIAWGDHLFLQDTLESINEATQLYVLAANILGERPQRVPPIGTVRAMTFAQLQKKGIGPLGNALVDLEVQFPFNLAMQRSDSAAGANRGALFGIGRALYFCIPRNDNLLSYWDKVADRLFKIRHGMNIQGVVRPLALFDPPIDPGMLVKAAAAGIDIASIVSGLNQPVGPVRSLLMIQKALELCGDVRNLGGALLSALEKGEAEHLALVRQGHDIKIQQMAQEVRFLQWKSAQESTQSLLTSRKTALERLHYYQRLLGLPADQNTPDSINLDRRELTEENFDEAYSALVGQYDKPIASQTLPIFKISGATSPSQESGASGSGRLYLNNNENSELNIHMPAARDKQEDATDKDRIFGILGMLPNLGVDFAFWGMGGHLEFGGPAIAQVGRILAGMDRADADKETYKGSQASKTAGYERRADEWILQYNLVAHELMQIGRQILTSLIAEQIAHHEYLNIQQQIANAQEIDQFLHDKFTNEDLYLWMQGEISRLYYEYYRFAFDTARKAERTMKLELMRPELDDRDFVKFNYWDGGRKGLLSGEALYLDVKRMEMAYHDNNKRELELVKHVSLRQLNPLALLALKATGSCQVTIPEWLYDLDCAGHYMRRIKSVALSIPAIVGPYTSANCTLSLLGSTLRKSAELKDGEYGRQGMEDDRFINYIGAVQSIVTSTAQTDSGLFEANLRDERFLPFEGAGAESAWKLDLPKDYPTFDYTTISDVILHIRYTARQGVTQDKVKSALNNLFAEVSSANGADLALLFSLRHDFPTEWVAFANGGDFGVTIRKDYFPYFARQKDITITECQVYGWDVAKHEINHHSIQLDPDAATNDLKDPNKKCFKVTAQADAGAGPGAVLTRATGIQVFMIVRYAIA